jgi:hypothetical protein
MAAMDALTVNILPGSGLSAGTPRMLNVNVQTVCLDGIRSSALSHICAKYSTMNGFRKRTRKTTAAGPKADAVGAAVPPFIRQL